MAKTVSASNAKNNFGGLLDDVAALGRVDIVKHGRLVAVVLAPRALEELSARSAPREHSRAWGKNHMIPPESARAAKMLTIPSCFDEE